MPPKKKFKIVDLFCGCGGMSLGLEKAGYDVVAGFDNWKPAIDVYEANFNHPVTRRLRSMVAIELYYRKGVKITQEQYRR